MLRAKPCNKGSCQITAQLPNRLMAPPSNGYVSKIIKTNLEYQHIRLTLLSQFLIRHPSENTDVPCPIWRPNVNLFASVFHHHQIPGLALGHLAPVRPSWVWVPWSRTVDWHSVGPWSERTRGSDSPSRAGRARAWACGKGARWARNARWLWLLSSRLLRTLDSAGGL